MYIIYKYIHCVASKRTNIVHKVKYQFGDKEHQASLPVTKLTSVTTAEENVKQMQARQKYGKETVSSCGRGRSDFEIVKLPLSNLLRAKKNP